MSDHDIHKSYTTGDIHNQVVDEHYDPNSHKVIWRTFWILLVVTVFEVGISFTGINKDVLQWTFVILTVVKAGFIVGYFMHLFHERKNFMYTILIPFILIVYLIGIALAEGVYLHIVK